MQRDLTTDVLLAVDSATFDLTADDRILAEALRQLGLTPTAHRWGLPVPPGANVLIRSTWDYVESPARFASWLDHLEAQEARVFNSTGVLRWNMHKRYLIDLDRAGVPTVPTELLESGTAADLSEIMASRGWADVVVKPAVGGTARHAIHLGRTGEAECRRQMAELLRREDVVIQPFIPTVTAHGELSVVAIAGVPLLAVKKSAAPGDWRVQTDFGGSAERTELTEELTTLARAALHGVTAPTAYARIDVLRSEGGELQIIELELVEPELFFRLDPAVAHSLARHLRDEFTTQDARRDRDGDRQLGRGAVTLA